MATAAVRLDAQARTPPAEWAVLPPYDGQTGTLWQAWFREKGAAYWLMKACVWLVNFVGRWEARLRGRVWHRITNPHALEDGGTFETRDEAEDRCRLAFLAGKAATICPVVIGRSYPDERVQAAGDFNPFEAYDFSATEAVKEQARHVLVDVDTLREITATLTARNLTRPQI
jgi:hypothetical protein